MSKYVCIVWQNDTVSSKHWHDVVHKCFDTMEAAEAYVKENKGNALQFLDLSSGKWEIRQRPTLDVPDWFWDNSTADWVAMDRDEMFYGYEVEPRKNPNSWIQLPNTKYFSLSQFTSKHNFNPHNIPWDQSLTKRPEE